MSVPATVYTSLASRDVLPAEFPASWAYTWGEDTSGLWMSFCYRGVQQCLRWIPPGEFLMGSPLDEPKRAENETQHRVIVSQGFWLGDTTCAQALWQAVMGENPSHFTDEERPVEKVSWEDVQRFLVCINNTAQNLELRLPTEAEWEYACRAGTTTAFWFGPQITPEQVNYNGNYPNVGEECGLYRKETVPVQALPCNGWRLYQMHGNVWEWCQDWYGEYPTETIVDPAGPAQGAFRVFRGGSWIGGGRHARSARRKANAPRYRSDGIGFRLARGQISRR